MRTTINIDDNLIAKASRLTGVTTKTALISQGLKALIQQESAKRLILLGQTEPLLTKTPRRQSDT